MDQYVVLGDPTGKLGTPADPERPAGKTDNGTTTGQAVYAPPMRMTIKATPFSPRTRAATNPGRRSWARRWTRTMDWTGSRAKPCWMLAV